MCYFIKKIKTLLYSVVQHIADRVIDRVEARLGALVDQAVDRAIDRAEARTGLPLDRANRRSWVDALVGKGLRRGGPHGEARR